MIYTNSSVKILSLDINVKKRKLYWFEFNKLEHKWSVGTRMLTRLNRNKKYQPHSRSKYMQTNYFTFEAYSAMNMFANDGYNFISVVQDNDNVNI